MLLINSKETLKKKIQQKNEFIKKKYEFIQKQKDFIQKQKDFIQKQKLTNKNIIQKSIFFKDMTFETDVIFDSKIIHLYSSSCSIIKHPTEKKFLLCVRVLNNVLGPNGNPINNDDVICLSCNKIITLDEKFNIVHNKMLYFDFDYDSKLNGIEDVRLYVFNNEIYFIGSSFNKYQDKVMIVSNKYNLNDNKFDKIYITPSFDTNFFWEKNWVFFENNGKLNIIYKWYPIYICEIDYKTQKLDLVKQIDRIPEFFNKLRGSTNGVLFDDKIWFITHLQRDVFEKKMYIHVFVVFDKNMNLIGFSNPFNFENALVEYCIGLLINNNNFVMTYSTLDCTTKLCVLPGNYVQNLIIKYNE
jgi:hypothetical protein